MTGHRDHAERVGHPSGQDAHLTDAEPGGEKLPVCRVCGANETVHRGLCRHCRRSMLGQGVLLGPEHVERPHQASPAPLHSPPWKHRGG